MAMFPVTIKNSVSRAFNFKCYSSTSTSKISFVLTSRSLFDNHYKYQRTTRYHSVSTRSIQSKCCFSNKDFLTLSPTAANVFYNGIPSGETAIMSHNVSTRCIHTSKSHYTKVRFPYLDFKTARENLKSAPMPALILGVSGLIPFVLPAGYFAATMSCSASVAYAQVAYGAAILSFLGGVRWGFALTETDAAKPDWTNLGYSVTPSLIAWLGLLMPLQPSLACLISGLFLAALCDGRIKSGYPAWFRSMRLYLSTFAIISLLVTYIYSVMFPEEIEKGLNWYKLVRIAQIILEE